MNQENYRSGFIAIVGRPNVGKSTLINQMLGQKIAAVSPRPQTTRRRQLGILTLEQAQIIFVDTPGLHKPHNHLGEFMNDEVGAALPDADVVIFVVDASEPPTDEDQMLADKINLIRPKPAVILAVNKIDLFQGQEAQDRQLAFLNLVPGSLPIQLSAQTGYHRDQLIEEIVKHIPEGPKLYDEEQITDLYEREISAELIREAALIHLRDEVPHSLAVRVDEFRERGETGAYIVATLFIERDSHKPIVIGQGGAMLKKIGSTARKQIEQMSGRKIFLELHVKVEKNWRSNPDSLRAFGYIRDDRD
jgi:GTP-binding protein Era